MQSGIPTIIPQQILQLRHIFGINTTLPRSVNLLSSDRIFYVAGHYGIVYNLKEKEKSQSYYAGVEGSIKFSSIAISSNKKLLAIGFKSNEKPCIYYYELNVSAKRKKIEYTDSFNFTSWSSVAFSTNSDMKHLASLTNKNSNRESILALWNPERGKCEAQIKIVGNEEKDFEEILFNPNSENQIISVLGEKTFLMYELKENIEEKIFTIEEVEDKINPQILQKYTLKSHIYLSTSQSILILAQQATIIMNYKGEIQQIIDEVGICCSNWNEGFLLGSNVINLYKYEENNYKIALCYDSFHDKDTQIQTISVYDEKILVMIGNASLLQGKIKAESNKNIVRLVLDPINLHYHCGPIVGMDICVRKPLIATASKDKTVKIWNFEDRSVETPKSEAEAASCLSFHPSGLHLAVAYSDKLKILNLQKDGESMSTFKDINSIRNCSYVKFSNGGQYFAAASGSLVHIFKFYTGQNPTGMTFSGHSGKIKCIAWNKEDNILVTCGTDGFIIAYRVGMENCGSKLFSMHSSKEPRIKGISYSSIALANDNTIYAMGLVATTGERVFKEIKLDGTDTRRELAQNNCGQIVFPSTGRILFCGTDDKDHSAGSIKCYKFPLTQHMEELQAHDNQGVEKISITSDDKYCITVGRDGCVMVFEIRDKEARSDKLKEVLPPSSEILITKSDLDTLKAEIDNLKQEKNELEGINVMGPIKDDHVKQLKDQFSSGESQNIQKYNAILEKKNLLRKKFDEEIRTRKEENENDLQKYDSNQAKIVMQKSAQYDELKRAQEHEAARFKVEKEKMDLEHDKDLQRLEQQFQKNIKNERDRKITITKKIAKLQKEHKETMKQIFQEKMQYLKKIDNENTQQVQNITEASLRAKSDVSITKKKISQKQHEKEQNEDQKNENDQKIKELEHKNEKIEKEIIQQSLIIQDRDKTIDANERRIYELKRKAQELEKFKYVLDHKIKELKKDIAPREQEIAKMKAQTNKMDKNLKDLNSLNTGLAEYVAVLFKDEQTLKAKIAGQRARISFQNNKIKSFKDAVYQSTQLIQYEPQLKKSAIELKNNFVSQSMTQVKMDSEIEQEYKNQRKYLQKSITMLKKNLQKDDDIHRHQNIRIMKENVDLIRDISSLRIEIGRDTNKRGTDDDKKGKNEPKEEEIRIEIDAKKKRIAEMRREIEDIQERINRL